MDLLVDWIDAYEITWLFIRSFIHEFIHLLCDVTFLHLAVPLGDVPPGDVM